MLISIFKYGNSFVLSSTLTRSQVELCECATQQELEKHILKYIAKGHTFVCPSSSTTARYKRLSKQKIAEIVKYINNCREEAEIY